MCQFSLFGFDLFFPLNIFWHFFALLILPFRMELPPLAFSSSPISVDLNGAVDDDALLFFDNDYYGFDLPEESPFLTAARCTISVISTLNVFLLRIFLASFAHFLISISFCQKSFANVLIGLVGLALVWANAERSELVLPLFLYFLSVTVVILFQQIPQKGIICSLFSIIFLFFCQLLYAAEEFNMMRGALMIAAMKMISLAFDTEEGTTLCANGRDDWHSFVGRVCAVFAFVFSPSTVLLGPPLQFGQFDEWTFRRVHSFSLLPLLKCVLHFSLLLLSALLFLCLSSCLIDPQTDFFPSHLTPWLFLQYLNAQSFRFSHFFVCYLASACATLAGHPPLEITRWTHIEWPQSMVQVVVYWNKPMHSFLHKSDVYQRTKVPLGGFFSLLLTFAVSSALHGFDIQMLSVLLSLGFFAFSETRLRDALSFWLSACVRSRECVGNCHHRYKKDRPLLVAARFCFSLINIFFLIYLGSPFHGEGQFTGYSAEHLLSIWRDQFRFSAHLIAFLFFLISFVIPRRSDQIVPQ